MDVGNELAFEIQYATEEQAIDAAFLLGDMLEGHDDVEEWSASYEVCPNCGHHVELRGTVTTFWPGETLFAVGKEVAEQSESYEGFLAGAIRAVETPA